MLALPRVRADQAWETHRASPCVLLVEDDELCRRALRRLLLRHGYTVLPAADGHDALQALAVHGADLVLTDLVMPRMDGQELLLRLAEDDPLLPAVAMTGASTPARRLATAAELGACGLLRKPFEAVDLLAALDAALGRDGA